MTIHLAKRSRALQINAQQASSLVYKGHDMPLPNKNRTVKTAIKSPIYGNRLDIMA